MEPAWIAEEQVTFVFPDGRRVAGRIAVGKPDAGTENAICPIALDGLFNLQHAVGGTPLQALLLGIRLLQILLEDFVAKGGRVVMAGSDDELPLRAYFNRFVPRHPAAE